METGFWAMGGYGGYVWSSYGITLAVLAANALAVLWRGRAVRRRLARMAPWETE